MNTLTLQKQDTILREELGFFEAMAEEEKLQNINSELEDSNFCNQ